MALLLEKHPLNLDKESTNEIMISSSKSTHYYITIENKELDDPISVFINCPHAKADVIVGKSNRELPSEIDITRLFI